MILKLNVLHLKRVGNRNYRNNRNEICSFDISSMKKSSIGSSIIISSVNGYIHSHGSVIINTKFAFTRAQSLSNQSTIFTNMRKS